MNQTISREEIEEQVRDLGEWFHNIDLAGVQTAPNHFLGDYPGVKWRRFEAAIPRDIRGASVLDIGCNGGFYSIEFKLRGASRVLGIDTEPMYLAQAKYAAEVYGVDLDLRCMSVYDVGKLHEKFDWVLFMGVFYHLRHPLLALDLIREHVCGEWLLFQSMLRGSEEVSSVDPDYPFTETEIFDSPGYPKLHFVENCYSSDPTNWLIPNRACAEAMLRSADFEIVAHPEQETYLCRPANSGGILGRSGDVLERA